MPRQTSKAPKTAKFQRLQIEIDNSELEKVERIKKRMGARTTKQVMMTSLRYYDKISEKIEQGYSLILEKQDGETLHRIEILFV